MKGEKPDLKIILIVIVIILFLVLFLWFFTGFKTSTLNSSSQVNTQNVLPPSTPSMENNADLPPSSP